MSYIVYEFNPMFSCTHYILISTQPVVFLKSNHSAEETPIQNVFKTFPQSDKSSTLVKVKKKQSLFDCRKYEFHQRVAFVKSLQLPAVGNSQTLKGYSLNASSFFAFLFFSRKDAEFVPSKISFFFLFS